MVNFWIPNTKFKKSRRGFTLVELLIVIALVGILATAILIAINPAMRVGQAYDAQRKSHLASIAHALQVQYVDRLAYPNPGVYAGGDGLMLGSDSTQTPSGGYWIPGLVPNYLKTLPKDPKQGGGPSLPVGLFGNFDVLAASTTFYVDCGATNGNGSAGSPWNNLSSANSASLIPGDKLLLKRGCPPWQGPLKAKWNGTSASPIIIGAYTSVGAAYPDSTSMDNLPSIRNNTDPSCGITGTCGEVVQITGSYQTLEYIDSSNDPPPTVAMTPTDCPPGWPQVGGNVMQPKGWRVGFRFAADANYNIVRNSKAHENTTGIIISTRSNYNKVFNNELTNNTYMSVLTPKIFPFADDDGGAAGIIVNGDYTEIANNTLSGNIACTYDYGADGVAIEIYGSKHTDIHHNKSNNDYSFVEVGTNNEKPLEHPSYVAEDTTLAYNLMTSNLAEATFLNVHGTGDFGPTRRTSAYNNTVYLTGLESSAVLCNGCRNDGQTGALILTLRNNILWAEYKALFSDVSLGANESNNIFWCNNSPPVTHGCFWVVQIAGTTKTGQVPPDTHVPSPPTPPFDPTSKVIDPKFVSGSDFHLQASSLAVNTGTTVSCVGCNTDLDGASPVGTVDIGAYEFGGVIPPVSGGGSLSCSPASQSVQTGVNANLTAVNGDASSLWSASGGSPASGTGVNFSVSFLTTGSKNVSVKSGDGSQQDTCVVDVTSSGGSGPPPATGTDFKYLYVVDADLQHFTLWATLEDKEDKQIHDKPNATCKKTPPDLIYNYCIGD